VFGITFDGGFAMGANLPMVTGGTVAQTGQGPGVAVEGVVPVVPVVPGQTTAGEISSGGLY
jgi:penicillin-binding protein 1A